MTGEIDKTAAEVPQFWILFMDKYGMIEDPEGYWTKKDRQDRAIELLEDGHQVIYTTASLMHEPSIRRVQKYWSDRKQNAENDLREHAEANPMGCRIGCEQCANLLKQYDATLSPSERAEGERKTAEAMSRRAESGGLSWQARQAQNRARAQAFKAAMERQSNEAHEQRLRERAALAAESYQRELEPLRKKLAETPEESQPAGYDWENELI